MKHLINKLPRGSHLVNKWKGIDGKDKIIYKNAAGAFFIKGLALLISFFTLPAYMRYLDNQQILGLWFTLVSVLIWILNFDLGIGNGLRNHLASELAKQNRESARGYISSAYFVLGTLMAVITLAGYFIIPVVAWNKFFNISADIIDPAVLIRAVQYTFLGIMLYFFLRIISSIIYALQKSALNNFLNFATNVLLLAVVLIAPSRSITHNLVLLAVSYGICLNLPLLIATFAVFRTTLKDCLPLWKCVSLSKTKDILSLGGIFFLCQILYMFIANTNEFFITRYTTPADVVDYQIYNRLFALVGMLFMLSITPIWSIVTKAAAEKDYTWLMQLNKRLFIWATLFSIGEIALLPFLPFILRVWLGSRAITINYMFALSFAVFGISMLFQNVVSTITNGLGRMRLQALCYGIGILVKIFIIHFGMKFWHSWVLVVLSNVLILIPYILIQNWANTKFLKRRFYA